MAVPYAVVVASLVVTACVLSGCGRDEENPSLHDSDADRQAPAPAAGWRPGGQVSVPSSTTPVPLSTSNTSALLVANGSNFVNSTIPVAGGLQSNVAKSSAGKIVRTANGVEVTYNEDGIQSGDKVDTIVGRLRLTFEQRRLRGVSLSEGRRLDAEEDVKRFAKDGLKKVTDFQTALNVKSVEKEISQDSRWLVDYEMQCASMLTWPTVHQLAIIMGKLESASSSEFSTFQEAGRAASPSLLLARIESLSGPEY